MKVGIIQPNYIPWRGYFDFIASVDLFVILDDVQYTRRDWRNRNIVKTPHGPRWLSVPVHSQYRQGLICDTMIDNSTDWRARHRNIFSASYAGTPYYSDAFELLENCLDSPCATISELDFNATRLICAHLGIATPLVFASTLKVQGSKTEKIVNLLKKVGATSYLSGPSAKAYLDSSLFEQNNLGLEYKQYQYPPYPQPWGNFDGQVTVLDLISCCGPDATSYMNSELENEIFLTGAGVDERT